MKDLKEEITKRRTFAIIAHPDAGKTTLTEKLLLFGGAIQLAGAVKARKNRKQTTSDWMQMERERGISITSAALQFEYKEHILNLLDTPGHEDFSEDTYRTLIAADCAVMVLDAAKGIETQTIKLFKVCQERGIPIVTFINKLDKPTKNLFDLLDEIEKTLGLMAIPTIWPLGTGIDFKGLYHIYEKKLYIYEKTVGGSQILNYKTYNLPEIKALDIDEEILSQFLEDIELIEDGLGSLEHKNFITGIQTPVFFGSAVNNLGVQLFLENFLNLAPSPISYPLSDGTILDPTKASFSGFVFKLQANMNRMHRDRIAFVRVCSGKFERGLVVGHNQMNKTVKLSSSFSFFGQERNIMDEAFAGDIIGLINPGIFKIGDVIAETSIPQLKPLPIFAPEIFATISCLDTKSQKSFRKGIGELSEEGIIHFFTSNMVGGGKPILGGLGRLQFDVFQRRLKDEYKTESRIEFLPYTICYWIKDEFVENLPSTVNILKDRHQNTVLIFESLWEVDFFKEKNENIPLLSQPPII